MVEWDLTWTDVFQGWCFQVTPSLGGAAGNVVSRLLLLNWVRRSPLFMARKQYQMCASS